MNNKYLVRKYIDISTVEGRFKENYFCIDMDEVGIYCETEKHIIFIPYTNISSIWVNKEENATEKQG